MIKKLLLFILLFSFLVFNTQSVFAAQNAVKDEEILIILDYSASMNKKLNDKTRARYVLLYLYDALATLPKNTKIGLRVFGPDNNYKNVMPQNVHTFNDCTATYLRVPIAENNAQAITDKLSEYTHPFGQTPVALSLKQAIENDFSKSNSIKHIILITDGTDTCKGNPCAYMQSVSKTRKDVVVDVISIADAEGNYGNLSCLPKLTKGRYVVVKSTDDIKKSFDITLKTDISVKTYEPVYKNNTVQEGSTSEPIEYSNYIFEINY